MAKVLNNSKTTDSWYEKMNEKQPECPNCGASVSRTDRFCKNCGKDLRAPSGFVQNETVGYDRSASEETYERKYSIFKRFYKLVVSPSEAMRDIGLTPDYGGPVVLVIIQAILGAVAVSMIFQKIQLTGDSQIISEVWGLISVFATIAVLIAVVLFFASWLVKSLLVKTLCDGGSDWTLGTAASVTGYAYLADVILAVVSMLVTYPLLPSVTLDVSNLDTARQALASFQAQALWIELVIAIPIGLVGLIWKSYLGGLGTKVGTHERSSLGRGLAVFFVLALFGWLISFLIRGTV